MDLGNGLGHLTYSTLVHPGDTWEEMWASLTTYVPKVKARVSPAAPFGVSLRLSAVSAQTLVDSASERKKLKGFLADNDMYLYTVNAFPYGPFKNQVVKEQARLRRERRDERRGGCRGFAAISPSIQSAPLGFKPRVTGPEVVAQFTHHVLRVAAHLVALTARTGRTVTLALEPEPYCFLETTDETVAYFTDHLYSGAAAAALARLAGIPISEAHVALRRHVGVVFDICHQAVVYENIAESLQNSSMPYSDLQAAEAAAMRAPRSRKDRRRSSATRRPSTSRRRWRRRTASSRASLTWRTPSRPGAATRVRANGAPISTFRCSSTAWESWAPRASPSRTRSGSTRQDRCRASSRSRPTPGTCCRST
jgi:hypothetical protein